MFQKIRDTWFRTLLIGLAVMLLLVVMGLIHLGLLRAQTSATIIYVQPVAAGTGDGSSWSNATTLQDAIQHRADAEKEIWVAAGTHYPVTPIDPAAVTPAEQGISFTLNSGVALYGGFAGTETARDQRDPATNLTVLSGDIDQNDALDDGNSRTVVNLSSIAATAVVDGFTITGGSGRGVSITGGSSPTFTNVTISDNGRTGANEAGVDIEASSLTATSANNLRAGVSISETSSPSFTDVTISDNSHFGVSIAESSATFADVEITGNHFDGLSMLEGSRATFTNGVISDNGSSGVYMVGARGATFTGATISANGASGVLVSVADSATFTDMTISDNREYGIHNWSNGAVTFTDGGISGNGLAGVYNVSSGPAVLTNAQIADNGDGGVANVDSSPTFLNVTISGNQARVGGGVSNTDGSSPTFTNVIISGNQSPWGGGVYNADSNATFTNVTISGNQAEQAGGGVLNDASTMRIRNSIIWGNLAGEGAQVLTRADGLLEFDSTLVQGRDLTGAGSGNLDGSADPQFVAPVAPDLAPTSDGDYQLQPGSPVADRGARRFLDETQTDVPNLNGDGDEDDTLSTDQRVDLGTLELPTP